MARTTTQVLALHRCRVSGDAWIAIRMNECDDTVPIALHVFAVASQGDHGEVHMCVMREKINLARGAFFCMRLPPLPFVQLIELQLLPEATVRASFTFDIVLRDTERHDAC
jgi:hypothetical protein